MQVPGLIHQFDDQYIAGTIAVSRTAGEGGPVLVSCVLLWHQHADVMLHFPRTFK